MQISCLWVEQHGCQCLNYEGSNPWTISNMNCGRILILQNYPHLIKNNPKIDSKYRVGGRGDVRYVFILHKIASIFEPSTINMFLKFMIITCKLLRLLLFSFTSSKLCNYDFACLVYVCQHRLSTHRVKKIKTFTPFQTYSLLIKKFNKKKIIYIFFFSILNEYS